MKLEKSVCQGTLDYFNLHPSEAKNDVTCARKVLLCNSGGFGAEVLDGLE